MRFPHSWQLFGVCAACAAEPSLEASLLGRMFCEDGATLRGILTSVTCTLPLAAEFVPKVPQVTSTVLRPDLPGDVRNDAARSVSLLFLGGHFGDGTARSAALTRLVDRLYLDSPTPFNAVLTNVSGCGKTKTALDLLQVWLRLWVSRMLAP